jgi:transketolase
MANSVEMDQLAINTIRMLVVDAVQKAKSGHPGTPMDAAPAAYTLWQRILRAIRRAWVDQSRPFVNLRHAHVA